MKYVYVYILPEGEADISQSTSNISLLTGSDSSPDSTPGLPRKLNLRESSAEQVSWRLPGYDCASTLIITHQVNFIYFKL